MIYVKILFIKFLDNKKNIKAIFNYNILKKFNLLILIIIFCILLFYLNFF